MIVTDVQPGSHAEDADMRAGDIIREINRRVVNNTEDFKDALKKAQPSRGIVMLVKRDNVSFYAVIKASRGSE